MEVWKDAQNLAGYVYHDFTKTRDYLFRNQIKRAAVSVSNNIALKAERTISAEFSRFLDIVKDSAGEIQVQSIYRKTQKLGFHRRIDFHSTLHAV